MADIKPLASELSQKLKTVFADRLLSVCLYGEAVDDASHLQGAHALIVVDSFSSADLEAASPASLWWEKQTHTLPLFMSKEEWDNASDVFALEYSDIQHRHWVVYGQDFYSQVAVDTVALRLICELEVYRKLIFLRQRLLLHSDSPQALLQFLKESNHSFLNLFAGMLRAYQPGQEVSSDSSAIFAGMSGLVSGFNSQPFHQVSTLTKGKQKLDKTAMLTLYRQYIEQLSLVNQFLNSQHALNI